MKAYISTNQRFKCFEVGKTYVFNGLVDLGFIIEERFKNFFTNEPEEKFKVYEIEVLNEPQYINNSYQFH